MTSANAGKLGFGGFEAIYPKADFTAEAADAKHLKIAVEDVARYHELVGGMYEAQYAVHLFLLQAQKRMQAPSKPTCPACGHLDDGHLHLPPQISKLPILGLAADVIWKPK